VRAAPEMAQGDDEHDNADAVAGEAHCPAPIRGHKPGNTPLAQRPSDRLAGPADSSGEAAHVLADDAVFEISGGRRQGKASLSYVLWQLIRRLSGRASHRVLILDDIVVEEGTFTGAHHGVPRGKLHNGGAFPRRGRSSFPMLPHLTGNLQPNVRNFPRFKETLAL
jgi:hypothetical protein